MPRADRRVRPLKRSELPRACAILCEAYVIQDDTLRTDMMRRIRLADCRGVEVDGGLVAVGRLLPLVTVINGRVLGVGGVAGLATGLAWRRQGHIKALVADMLAEMRKRAMPLSALYPFSIPFYARLGWTVADEKRLVTVPTRFLAGRPRPAGRVDEIGFAEVETLRALHDAFGANHNLCTRRTSWWFEHYVLQIARASSPPRRLFCYRSLDGVPEGYVLFWYRPGRGESRQLAVHELCWATAGARAGLLAFLGDFDSQADEVELRLPVDDPLVAELTDAECRIAHELGAMWRVVDVAAALADWPVPDADGEEAVFALEDDFAPWNRGTWRLRVERGRTVLQRARRPPDFALTPHVLAQLVTGYLAPAQAARAGRLIGLRPERAALLGRLAGARTPFFNDYF